MLIQRWEICLSASKLNKVETNAEFLLEFYASFLNHKLIQTKFITFESINNEFFRMAAMSQLKHLVAFFLPCRPSDVF